MATSLSRSLFLPSTRAHWLLLAASLQFLDGPSPPNCCLEHGVPSAGYFSYVFEGLVEEDVERRREVLNSDRLSDLRRMNDRGMEDYVVCEKRVEAFRVS